MIDLIDRKIRMAAQGYWAEFISWLSKINNCGYDTPEKPKDYKLHAEGFYDIWYKAVGNVMYVKIDVARSDIYSFGIVIEGYVHRDGTCNWDVREDWQESTSYIFRVIHKIAKEEFQ